MILTYSCTHEPLALGAATGADYGDDFTQATADDWLVRCSSPDWGEGALPAVKANEATGQGEWQHITYTYERTFDALLQYSGLLKFYAEGVHLASHGTAHNGAGHQLHFAYKAVSYKDTFAYRSVNNKDTLHRFRIM